MKFDIISLLPDALNGYYQNSILGRAQKKGLISIRNHDLRSYATDKYRHVDDTPYGGGPGMVLRIDIVHRALSAIYRPKGDRPLGGKKQNVKTRVILLTPRGKTFDQRMAKRLTKYDRVILIAGRYEAIDARIDHFVDEKISLGNFLMTGGELAAAAVVDSVARLLPGVLGAAASLDRESFSEFKKGSTNVEYPQYTRPEVYKKLRVPKMLLSGDHGSIAQWRAEKSGFKKIV